MKQSKADLLDEVKRLRAENVRLAMLVDDAARPPVSSRPPAMSSDRCPGSGWYMEVGRFNEPILSISQDEIVGCVTVADKELIRACAQLLLSFVGPAVTAAPVKLNPFPAKDPDMQGYTAIEIFDAQREM